MEIALQSSDVEEDLISLRGWLLLDEEVRRHAQVSLKGPSHDDELGTTIDVIQLLVDSGLQVASLVVAVAAWIDGRRAGTRASVVVTIRSGNRTATLVDADEETVDAAIKALTDRS